MYTFVSAPSIFELLKPHSVGLTVFVLAIAAVAGLALGSLKLRGVSLGIGGVLFAGLIAGQFLNLSAPRFGKAEADHGAPATAPTTQGAAGVQPREPAKTMLNAEVVEFARELGLILFVYTIGVQVGPGFIASLRRQGLPLNLMATSIVVLGVVLTIVVWKVSGMEMRNAVGVLCGGVTNTPSLGAAQEAIRSEKGLAATSTATAYAIAYPFGVVGIIVAMILFRVLFRINVKEEAGQFEAQTAASVSKLQTLTLEVTNPNLRGREIRKIPAYDDGDVVVSRVLRQGKVAVATPQTKIDVGDVLLAVGPQESLEDLRVVVGRQTDVDLRSLPSQITTRRVLVTKNEVLGKTIDELNLSGRLGVSITRVRRGEVELPPAPTVALQFGDTVMAVGDEAAISKAAAMLGDSTKRLNHPQVIPIFVGLALGVLVGSIPIPVPGVPYPVKLGLAGGPLLVAIVLSRLGHFGPLIWHLPQSANFALRELGIVMFLAAVGIKSGGEFFDTLLHGPGLQWMGWGALITLLPLVVVGFVARHLLKLNYMSLCGLLAGSMTDPPALAFAGTVTGSDAPGIAYAAVYPLVMLLRVLTAQMLVLFFV